MRSTIYGLLAGLALFAGACSSTGVNTADVFTPVTGSIVLNAQTSDSTIQSVDFELNQKSIGSGTAGSGGWTLNFDSTRYPNGIYNLTATGVTAAGTSVQLLNNSLLINNATSGSGASGTSTPATTASGASFFIPAPTSTPPWL